MEFHVNCLPHEIPSFIFSEKLRIFYATLMFGAIRVKHCKWVFKH